MRVRARAGRDCADRSVSRERANACDDGVPKGSRAANPSNASAIQMTDIGRGIARSPPLCMATLAHRGVSVNVHREPRLRTPNRADGLERLRGLA